LPNGALMCIGKLPAAPTRAQAVSRTDRPGRRSAVTPVERLQEIRPVRRRRETRTRAGGLRPALLLD